MTRSLFVARYRDIYEGSPWVAERAAAVVAERDSVDAIARVMAACVETASRDEQLQLIRAHPDLAPRRDRADRLTATSASEQASAGLDECSDDEAERFRDLNRNYRNKFGFPFVMAVRDRRRAGILEAFELRLKNDLNTEFATAMGEIHKIARLRLDGLR